MTVEETLKQGIKIVGTKPQNDFFFSSRTDSGSFKNCIFSNELKRIVNSNIILSNYSKEKIKQLTFTFIIMAFDPKGIDWRERKSYSRTDKNLYVEIKVPDYEHFCSAEKTEVLQIMAEQTLRGSQLFLSKEKDFDFPKFYTDLSELFHKQGWV